MTQQFLDKMEDKVDLCTSAPKAKDLIDELDVYMSATNDQQSARLEQVRSMSVTNDVQYNCVFTILRIIAH